MRGITKGVTLLGYGRGNIGVTLTNGITDEPMLPKHVQILEKISHWVVEKVGIEEITALGDGEGPRVDWNVDYLYDRFYGVDEEFTRWINHLVPARITSRVKRQEMRLVRLRQALCLAAIQRHHPVLAASAENTADAALAEESLVSV